MEILRNYKSTIILLMSLMIGAIIGIYFDGLTELIAPIGTLFINLILTLLVPLLFVSIVTAIINVDSKNNVSRLFKNIFLSFIIAASCVALLAMPVGYLYAKNSQLDEASVQQIMDEEEAKDEEETEEVSLLAGAVDLVTVEDFGQLFNRENMMAITVMAILIAITINKLDNVDTVIKFFNESNDIIIKLIDIIMSKLAPIGLMAFFASTINSIGGSILSLYATGMLYYIVACLFVHFTYYVAVSYFWGGSKGVKQFLLKTINPILTAMATCSSSATMPAAMLAAEELEIPDDVAKPTIALAVSVQKHGSVIGLTLKGFLLFSIFRPEAINDPMTFVYIFVMAIIASLLMASIPTGGFLGEMLMISTLGFPAASIGILAIFATMIDMPATVYNVLGDISSAQMVDIFQRKQRSK